MKAEHLKEFLVGQEAANVGQGSKSQNDQTLYLLWELLRLFMQLLGA